MARRVTKSKTLPRNRKGAAALKRPTGTATAWTSVLLKASLGLVLVVLISWSLSFDDDAQLSQAQIQLVENEAAVRSSRQSTSGTGSARAGVSGLSGSSSQPKAPQLSASLNSASANAMAAASTETNTVAYAISMIKCGDFQTFAEGLTDAAMILRHSVHMTSIRNPSSGSKYDYKMYAIIHRQAEKCSSILADVGFTPVIVDPPVDPKQIRGQYLKRNIHKEWCCGSDEFVKLFAYTLPEPVIVHVDIDFAFYQPMDNLFDAILYDKDSEKGMAARQSLLLERPNEPLPDRIDAFITRDWPQSIPGRKAMYQAGFLLTRRDETMVQDVSDVVLEGNYTSGYQAANGWSSAGYGGYVGSMAMQGLMAYFYDMVRPNTAVELNQCRYNHMGLDVRYNHHPNFMKNRKQLHGKCRNNSPDDVCEDCMHTDMSMIYNVHYTYCRKPWNCQAKGYPGGRKDTRGDSIDTDAVDIDHCLMLVHRWHEMRTDFENKLYELTGDELIKTSQKGKYREDIFMGHCDGDGGRSYRLLKADDATWKRVQELYTS